MQVVKGGAIFKTSHPLVPYHSTMLHHMDKQNKSLNLSEHFLISLMYGLNWRGHKSGNIFTYLTSIDNLVDCFPFKYLHKLKSVIHVNLQFVIYNPVEHILKSPSVGDNGKSNGNTIQLCNKEWNSIRGATFLLFSALVAVNQTETVAQDRRSKDCPTY